MDFNFLDAADAASGFLRLIIEKLESQPAQIVPVMPQLLGAARQVAKNQAVYDADKSIYGDFSELYGRIDSLYRKTADKRNGS